MTNDLRLSDLGVEASATTTELVDIKGLAKDRLIRWYLKRRGVPDSILNSIENKKMDSDFWEFILKFLVEFGLPALLEFLKRLLDDIQDKNN
jgi:hypothetical protein